MQSRPRIVVTGGAGFIGSHTCVELIEAGYDPIVVDDFRNSDYSALVGIQSITGRSPALWNEDCSKPRNLARAFKVGNVAGVIHFAAYKSVRESMLEPIKYYRNNIESLSSVLEVMQAYRVKKLVFSSSCTVYGDPKGLPVTEESEVGRTTSPYGFSKVVCERMIGDLSAIGKLEPTILRYFNPIGAHPSSKIGELPSGTPSNLVPLMAQAAAGLRPNLTIFGATHNTADGTCVRDYVHVMDIAKAHVLALGSRPTTVNLGIGRGISVKEIISSFERINGVKVPHEYAGPAAGDVAEVWCRAEKAFKDLGWRPERSVDDALKDAWNWQRSLA